jgi:phytoene dehydrogenase-like protein
MTQEKKTIAIVGGGIAGLASGCYAQMNGYECTIYEMHEKPGGCCTSWERREFEFDWCISWLYGSGTGNEMAAIWDELGALAGKRIRNFEIFNSVVAPSGEQVHFYSDPDKLERHLLEISPPDAKLIREFCGYVRQFMKSAPYYPFLKNTGLMNPWEKLRLVWHMLPYARLFMKTAGTRMDEFARRFEHPLLREAMNHIFYERHETFPLMPYCFTLASSALENCGVPDGGSMGMARSLERRFISLGGKVRYHTKVERIHVENDKAVGIRLADGTTVDSDYVIAACDGPTVLGGLLQGKYSTPFLDKAYGKLKADASKAIFPGVVTLYLGLDRDYSDHRPIATYLLTEEQRKSFRGMVYAGVSAQVRSALYPTHAPKGKSILYITYLSDYESWAELTPQDRMSGHTTSKTWHTSRVRTPAYRQAKKQLVRQLIDVLSPHYEGLRESIEEIDISTPLTSVRYTGNHNGTILAWLPFSDHAEEMEKHTNKHSYQLPGLKNFYFNGQWTVGGCVTRAAATGRHVVLHMCRAEGRAFRVIKEELASADAHEQAFGDAPSQTSLG